METTAVDTSSLEMEDEQAETQSRLKRAAKVPRRYQRSASEDENGQCVFVIFHTLRIIMS